MKITFAKEMKSFITIDEMTAVRNVINAYKEDTGLNDYAHIAFSAATGYGCDDVLKVTAQIAKNSRKYNVMCDDSRNIDIWVELVGYSDNFGFAKVGFYLSDLWNITGNEEEDAEVVEHFFIRRFPEVNL